MKPLCIWGAGAHGREVYSICRDAKVFMGGFRFVHLGERSAVMGAPVIPESEVDNDFVHHHRFIVAVGDNRRRLEIGQFLLQRGAEVATVIHPTAVMWGSCFVHTGSVIFPFAIVSDDASIGRFCIINKRATVGHDAVIEDGVNLCDGVTVSGHVGTCAFIGLHAAVLPKVNVGANAVIGAGSVVRCHIPDGEMWAGGPATPKKPRRPMTADEVRGVT